MSHRHTVSLLLKIAVTLGLIAIVLRNVDLKAVSERLLAAQPAWFGAGLVLIAIQVALTGLRWQHIAERLQLPFPPARAVRLAFIGSFFSQALPSAIGGDVVRAWLVARETGKTGRVISSVLCDRASGLVVLLLIASVGLFAVDTRHPALGVLRLAVWSVTGAALVVLVLGAELARPIARFHIGAKIRQVLVDLRATLAPPWKLSAAIAALAVAGHLALIVATWCFARSLDLPLDLGGCLVMIPTIMVASMIPVSIGGWGVREGAMVLGLGMLGIPGDGALALSILYGLGSLVVALPGGLLWITTRGHGAFKKSSSGHA